VHKLKTKYPIKKSIILLSILSFTLISCKKENSFFDKQGNEFIEKEEKLHIIPAEYQKTGELYKIFLYNQTDRMVTIENTFALQVGEKKVFKFADTDSILLDIGSKIYFGDNGLETEDKENQIAGIGGEYWKIYHVPDDVEYGFVIVPPGQGDSATE
jgi:hypothetical protein